MLSFLKTLHPELEYHSQPCIFLGYNSKHKGYLCFHLPSHRLCFNHHVVFDETSYPFASQSKESNCIDHSLPSGYITLSLLQDASILPFSSTCLSPTSPTSSNTSPAMSPASIRSPTSPIASPSSSHGTQVLSHCPPLCQLHHESLLQQHNLCLQSFNIYDPQLLLLIR